MFDGTNRMFILFACFLLSLIPVHVWSNPLSEMELREVGPSSDRNLEALVKEYLKDSSPERSQELLADIQQMPEASVESIAGIIQQRPVYEMQPVGAQPHRPVTVRGVDTEFALYVPEQYRPEQAHSLILCLHGAGFTGEAYLDRWVPRLEDGYILACPTISMGGWWTRHGEELVLETIRAVQSQYHIDPNRIFLTGMSNGGIGAWIIGMHHADQFAGIAPMASGIDTILYPFLENLSHTPVYVIHGVEDRIMPVQLSRDLVKEMQRRDISFHYQEHSWTHPHAGGHFFPRQELPALLDWFNDHQRTRVPRKVSLVRDATHLTPFYWVRIDITEQIAAFSENLIDSRDQFIAGAIYAKLHAEMTAPNTIVVHTNRIRRYTIFLNQDLVDFSRSVIVKTNGKPSFEGRVEPSLEILLQEARRRSASPMLYQAKLTIDVPSPDPAEKP